MNPVLRGLAIYVFLLIVFRIMGKRHLSEITTFDFVILLIISETTTSALVGEDFSIVTSAVLICTLMGTDLILSLLKDKSKTFGLVTEGAPIVIVDHGKPLRKRMEKVKVDDDDVLNAARQYQGLEKMEQIKYAVLEKDGKISIIPMEQ